MYKKTLLSLAIASTLTLTGCLENDKDNNENADSNPNGLTTEEKNDLVAAAGTYPIWNPAISALPIPNDLIFSGTVDGTFVVPNTSPPVTSALNSLSGASTIAPIDIAMSGLIREDSVYTNALNSNIFLVALDYASGNPVQGLPIGEPPTASSSQPSFTHEVITLTDEDHPEGTSYLRIHPTSPLDPLTRYVVIITDEVLDSSDERIKQSPSYANITDENEDLLSDALEGVRSLTNSLWEPIALGTFNTPKFDLGNGELVSLNTARGAVLSLPPLTEANIALSYSFTTSNDEKVLDYIADPASWITSSLTDLVKVTATKGALAGGASDHAAVEAAVNTAFEGWLPSTLNPALAGCDAAPGGQPRFDCAGTGLYNAFEGGALGFTANFPDPEATTITMNGAPVDVTTLVPSLAPSIPAGAVLADQGTITIPYYSGLPAGFPTPPDETIAAAGGGFPLKYTSWEADATLATTLNIAFYCAGLAIPQGMTAPAGLDCAAPLNPADFTIAPKSTVVNYLYPFPKKQDDVTIPILSIYPNPAAIGGATDLKTMIWGHGLTGDRSNALGYGSLLVAQGIANATATAGASLNAVIAIDEPLHGVVSGPLEASSFGAIERHFGYQSGGTGPTNPPVLIQAGGSGSMWINPENFLTFRDTNRQHTLDLMTVRKSLPATTLSGNTLDQEYFYSGHSLGTINSQAFVAIVNDTADTSDNITAAAFFTPGGGVSRFVENSPAFAPTLLDGLALAGLTTDSASYQTFLNTFQAASDSFDAVNFVDRLPTQNTQVLYFEAANDLVIPVSQASTDRTLQTTTGNGTLVSGSVSYLSGAEPLFALSQASALSSTPGIQAITQAVARYKPCIATHGTPSIPAAPGSAFAENLAHNIMLIISNGAQVQVTPAAATLFQDLPLPAIIYDEANGCP